MSTEKKKLLFIVEAMGGGVFTYIVELANELVSKYDVYVAYALRKQTPADYSKYFDERVHLIKVENFKRSIDIKSDIKAFLEIRRIAKDINPDIIHLHSSKAGALGRMAFNGRKVPVFYTPHGYSFLMKHHSSTKRLIYKIIETVCGKRRCTTISCSEGEHKETLKINKRATYVDNGINVSELQEYIEKTQVNKDTNSEKQFTVFTLGRICEQKNPALFNEIALKLPDIKFLWIGDGDLRDELSAPNIEITGWMSRREALNRALSEDVFVLTSLWEGLPIALLESMYMKKLCIVSNIIGNQDVISTGRNGFLCENANDFVKYIENAKMGKYSILIDNAYADVINKYNTQVMARRYSEIYVKSLDIVEKANIRSIYTSIGRVEE